MKSLLRYIPLLAVVGLVATAGAAEAAPHASGTVVRHANGNWLYNNNGTLHWVSGPDVLGTWGYMTSQIVAANSEDNALPTDIVNPLWPRAGSIIKQPGDANIYVIDYSGATAQKRLVTSPQVLFDLGYNQKDIIVPPVNVNLLPATDGSALSSAAVHPNGALVSSSPNGGDVYLMDNGVRRWVPFNEILWNLTHDVKPMRRVLQATAGDNATGFGAHASFMAGTLVNNQGNLSYIGLGASGPETRYITSVNNLPQIGWPYVTTIKTGQYGISYPPSGPNL